MAVGREGTPLPASERLTQLVNPFHPSNQPSLPQGSQSQGCLPSCWWMSDGTAWEVDGKGPVCTPSSPQVAQGCAYKPRQYLPAKPQCNCPLVQLDAFSPVCCFPIPPKLFAQAQMLFKRGDQNCGLQVISLCNTSAEVSPKLAFSKIPKKM